MGSSRRAALRIGFGLGGVFALMGRALGQSPRDEAVSQAKGDVLTRTPEADSAARIGVIDVFAVFKGYEKAQEATEAFKNDARKRSEELQRLTTKGRAANEMLAKLTPGSPEYKKIEAQIADLKSQFDACGQRSKEEFGAREGATVTQLYGEIRAAVTLLAKQRGLNCVLRYSNEPFEATNSEKVRTLATMSVVYAVLPDLTQDVIDRLNAQHRAASN